MDAPYLARIEGRRELSEFVIARRERTQPGEVGLAAGGRRRTPGLRREEVAQLAGVGLTWYTWFEQGRDIRVSAHFLERVCRALRLNAAERAYLFMLAQDRPPPRLQNEPPAVSPAVRAMLNSLPNPAYITTPRWDVAAWNPPAANLFCDYAALAPEYRNHLWLILADPRSRRLLPDWEHEARDMVAKFRLDHGRANGDPAFEALVAMLEAASPEFRRWWPLQDVSTRGEGVKRFHHETLGELRLQHTAFRVEGAAELRMVIYTPVAGVGWNADR